MMRTFAFFPAFLVTFGFVACGNDQDGTGQLEEYECYENADCDAGSECSAGSCFSLVSCADDSGCDRDQSCHQGHCRTHCVTDGGCAATNGACDPTLNLCMPGVNPDNPGGGDGDGDAANPPGDGDAPGDGDGDMVTVPEPMIEVVDDLLDGDQQILMTGGRQGHWYDYSDASASRPVASAPTMEDGRMAIHATGSHQGGIPADEAFGGLGMELNNPTSTDPITGGSGRVTYDASAWDGFQFWVKSGSGLTKSIRFELVTSAIAGTEEGGACSGEGCWDSFGRDIALTTEWKLVKIPFSSLVQEGWGANKTFDAATILGVAFEDRTTSPWDFWVGEIALYEDPEGTTPTTPVTGSCSGGWGGYSEGSITKYWFTQGTTGFGDINCSYGIANVGGEAGGDAVNHTHTGSG